MSDKSAPTLCVVPARGGSKGIPRKVLQPVAGVPLLLRTLDTIRKSDTADRIVVSTEDKDIASFARLRGFEVLDRPAELAQDDVPLSDVIRHAVETLDWQGTVLVCQPTCPLLTSETVVSFIDAFNNSKFDWAISAAPVGHIVWDGSKCLSPRVNRQQLPSHVKQESGALQIMSSAYALVPSGRRGTIEIPAAEALDIDTHADLAAARQTLGRKRVHFHVAAGVEVGSGHFWRCLQLSDALSHHQITWSFQNNIWLEFMQALLDRHGVDIVDGPAEWADLLIVDALDAAETIVPHWKAQGAPVVLFEWDGPARRFADLVVDEFADSRWTVLRPEFTCLPAKPVAERGQRVLVTFGGTDPAGLGQRVASMLGYALHAKVRVVQGPGAPPITGPQFDKRVKVVTDANMAEEMYNADLVVTSQGRTVAEAVACGTAVLSVAQNERESRHSRLPGVVYLGLHVAVSDQQLIDTASRLLDKHALRMEMTQTASEAQDGLGVERIVWEIEKLLRGL